jgi:hypothetical protein
MPTTNDEKYGGKTGSSTTEHFHLAEKQNALTFGGKGGLIFDKDDLVLKDSEGGLIEVNSIELEELEVKLVSKEIKALGQVYKFGPVGIKFQKPGILTLPYICDWGLPFEGTIQVYSYSEVLDSWQATKKISQDFQNKTVTVGINHFSSYIPGTGSYQVDESGTLAGLPSIENVDPYFGTLTLERKDVSVHARGVRLSISSKFNTDIVYDDLYSPTVTANGGTAAANTIKHYIFAKGWNWQLPFITIGANVCKVQWFF